PRRGSRSQGSTRCRSSRFGTASPESARWSRPASNPEPPGRQMEQRVSLITLGVRDLALARDFYEALGWTSRAEPGDDVVFFQTGCMVVALWDRAKLAHDSEVPDSGGWGGV